MATEHESILEKARRDGLACPSAGFDVPDGYFESFVEKMSASLPPQSFDIAASRKKNFWTMVRPYVYMAAMFAGIWLMLQLFTLISGTGTLQPMDSNPIIAEALSNDDFVYNYIYDDLDTWDVMDEMMEDGIPADSLIL